MQIRHRYIFFLSQQVQRTGTTAQTGVYLTLLGLPAWSAGDVCLNSLKQWAAPPPPIPTPSFTTYGSTRAWIAQTNQYRSLKQGCKALTSFGIFFFLVMTHILARSRGKFITWHACAPNLKWQNCPPGRSSLEMMMPCRVVIATREFALTISLKTYYLAFRRAETKLPSSPAIEPWQVQTISRIQLESTMILNLSLKTEIYRSIWKTAVNVAEKHVGEQATEKKNT